jgi:Secretion system C-terminal sorting domain
VRVEFIASDNLPGHFVEAAVDVFKVELGTVGSNTLNSNAMIIVSPNPSNSDFQVQYAWEDAPEMPVIEVRNLLGQVVFSEKTVSKSGIIFCGNNWVSGVYFATLHSGGKQGAPLKLIKQ